VPEYRVVEQHLPQVGNSGGLLNASHGEDIDAHEAVWRLNVAPTKGYERDVGRRTTLQMIASFNQKTRPCSGPQPTTRGAAVQATRCEAGDPRDVCKLCVPNGDGVPTVIRPVPEPPTMGFLRAAKQRHPLTPFLHISPAHKLLCHAVVSSCPLLDPRSHPECAEGA